MIAGCGFLSVALVAGAAIVAAARGPAQSNIERYLNELVSGPPAGPSTATKAPVVWPVDSLTAIGGHPATPIGTPRVVERDGYKAVEFNGATDGILLDVNPVEGLDRFTVEAIVWPDEDGPAEQRFIHIGETGSENRVMLETRIFPGRTWSFDTYLRSNAASRTLLDPSLTHRTGGWHAVAVTYDGSTMTSHVDGVKELSGVVDFKPLGPGRTALGVRLNRVSWFKGRIRLVRITPDVLTGEGLLHATAREPLEGWHEEAGPGH